MLRKLLGFAPAAVTVSNQTHVELRNVKGSVQGHTVKLEIGYIPRWNFAHSLHEAHQLAAYYKRQAEDLATVVALLEEIANNDD